jgi:hypothetical protein
MKKSFIIIVACLLSILINAQDNKPTKEETVAYINEFLESQKEKDLFSQSTDNRGVLRHENKLTVRMASLELEDGLVYLASSSKSHYSQFLVETGRQIKSDVTSITHNLFIDDVEEIQIVGYNSGIGLFFKRKGEEPVSERNYLPLWPVEIGVERDYKESQIYKAFQHLRKLCGAPEPISFD